MEILENQYLSAGVILVTQFIFIYLRTLNVIYTAEKKILSAIITGNGIGLAWLISISIGANAIMKGEPLPILAFLIGGSVGTYLGIKKELNRNGKK
jgi:uncharacterized membrane protein YqgA involved in biofilm formation